MPDTDAVIVGGGIGGLCCALALRQTGRAALVLERAGERREIGAALMLWPNALRAFAEMRLDQTVQRTGSRVTRLQTRAWYGRVLADFAMDKVEEQLGAATVCIHRADLLDVLASALGDDPIRLGVHCVQFEEDDSGVRAHCADGRVVSGHFLVGADGIRSAVRAQLHRANGLRYAGYTCWRGVARLEHSALAPGLTTETWGRGRRFGLCPLGKGRIGWWATRNARQGVEDNSKERKRDVQQAFRGWHEPIEAVLEATEAGVILRHDVFDLGPRRRWGDGRVTLLGDAAHATTPDLGQGACLAVEDALVLTRCLAQAHDVVSALRHYENKRSKKTARVGRWARWQGSVGQWEGTLACALRDATCWLTPSAVQVRTLQALIRPIAPL